MHLACCQLNIAWEDKAVNYRRVEALLDAAAFPAGTLVLLPEMFATGFTMAADSVAEPLDGPTARFLSDLARRREIFVQAGVVIRDPCAPRPRNEALVFGPDGKLSGRYAKLHLFSFAGEPEHYAAGEASTQTGKGGPEKVSGTNGTAGCPTRIYVKTWDDGGGALASSCSVPAGRVAFGPADRRIQRALTEGLRFERGHASVLHVGEQLMPARPMELLLDRGLPWGIIASDP